MASVVDRLAAIDPRVIYIVMGLAVFIPIVFPIGLSVTITPPTQAAFDAIESVPKGEFRGDALQRVVSQSGQSCGIIPWESKRTRNWTEG